MFDDLILLAKGGLTAYHGPVKKVEEYFSGLGIHVPERVNPPDYYIDILEGIIKPNTSTGINYKELPLRWMLHNGYDVPRDMLQNASDLDSSVRGSGSNAAEAGSDEPSIAGEVWDNVKDIVGQKRDEYEYNFSKSKETSTSVANKPCAIRSALFKTYCYGTDEQNRKRLRTQAGLSVAKVADCAFSLDWR